MTSPGGGGEGLPKMMIKSNTQGRGSLDIATSPILTFILIIYFISSYL